MCCLVLSGCGGGKTFTEEDFGKLKKGMSESEVNAILGAPDRSETPQKGIKRVAWKRGKKEYSAAYSEGKLDTWNILVDE
jgi:hypothetical protein